MAQTKRVKKKPMKLGGGGRFESLTKKIEAKGKSPKQAKGIAAKVGMEKYGKSEMESLASKGKKRAAVRKKKKSGA